MPYLRDAVRLARLLDSEQTPSTFGDITVPVSGEWYRQISEEELCSFLDLRYQTSGDRFFLKRKSGLASDFRNVALTFRGGVSLGGAYLLLWENDGQYVDAIEVDEFEVLWVDGLMFISRRVMELLSIE